MITDVTQLINLTNATRNKFVSAGATMTFNDVSHELFNTAFENAKDDGVGPKMEWDVTLKDTGNAKMTGLYDEDAHNKKNTTDKGYAKWSYATTNVEWDVREAKINSSGPEKLYDVLLNDTMNMYREFGELVQPKLLFTPSASTDKVNPMGLASWLTLGTADQDGGFNGYTAAYNDGTGGNTFYPGEITCSSTVNTRWASYYADHQGVLGDKLIAIIDEACLSTMFIPTSVPKVVDSKTMLGNLRFYTNKEIILNLKQLMRKNGDDVAGNFGKVGTLVSYMQAPIMYVPTLDTASTYLWGTNPIFGVNWDWVKITCMNGFKFKLGQAYQKDNSHNVCVLPLDLAWCMYSPNRQRAGFQISQHA